MPKQQWGGRHCGRHGGKQEVDKVAGMELDMVADMEVDKVAG